MLARGGGCGDDGLSHSEKDGRRDAVSGLGHQGTCLPLGAFGVAGPTLLLTTLTLYSASTFRVNPSTPGMLLTTWKSGNSEAKWASKGTSWKYLSVTSG